MPLLTMDDGTEIFFKDWGSGKPIIFLHGWPLSGDMWDNQMLVFGRKGFRVIAPDRRGFGRSGQNWDNNTNERAADDLAALIAHLDLSNVVLVGHSMSGGEIAKYAARHGTARLAKIVTIGANLPQILKTEANPHGFPKSDFDDMRKNVLENRSDFLLTMPKEPFGFNRLANKTHDGLMRLFWSLGMQAGIKPMHDYIAQFSEPDFTEDLRKVDIPVLIIHGEDDQGTPVKATAERAVNIYPNATLKIYPKGTHMISMLNEAEFNMDLENFIEG